MSGQQRMVRASTTRIFTAYETSPKWRKPLKVPAHAHPFVRHLYRLMNNQRTTMLEVAERSGLRRQTIWDWGNRVDPRVSDLDAALQTLGYRLRVEAIPE